MGREGAPEGVSWKLRRAVRGVQSRFRPAVLAGRDTERAATAYVRALLAALHERPALARDLFARYDARLPADAYAAAFDAAETAELGALAALTDQTVLTVVIDVAARLGDDALRRRACHRLAGLLGAAQDADALVSWLSRLHDRGALDAGTVTEAVTAHTAQTSLHRDEALWSAFFDHLPEPLVPDRFETALFLGRGADAVRLADTPARRRTALACCVTSPRLDDVRAGLELADAEGDAESARRLAERAGDLVLARNRPRDALAYYERAGLRERMSHCHEQLGEFRAALETCPADEPDRLARLAGACRAEIDALVERGEHTEAVRRTRAVLSFLDRAGPADAVTHRRTELEGLRQAVAALENRRLESRLHALSDAAARRSVHQEWSRFAEAAGELLHAARHAEDAAELYRAHRFYQAAGHFGDADRVLHDDASAKGLTARAAAREAGGDLLGAARLYEQAGRHEEAVVRYEQAGDPVAAARCLIAWRGHEAIEDPRLPGFLRRSGDLDELARRSLDALAAKGNASRAAGVLRSLVDDETTVTGPLRQRILQALQAAGAVGRGAFEERIGPWARRAKEEVDGRFSRIWGMDLGTSTCVASVYDTHSERPVVCPDAGRPSFAATLSVTGEGEEIVGLTGDAVLARRIVGHISAAKRDMGDRRRFKIQDRLYRPEEVAARLVRHARTLVESFLTEQVKERIAALARDELGQCPGEWLDWAVERHDLVLRRPDVIVTIPAYFRNNAKDATRSACTIAGVSLIRMIHEPTAACMAVARQRRLDGHVAVVDLGAGTLDGNVVEVGDNVYEGRQPFGDDKFGGKDFDTAVTAFLADRLRTDEGLDVPAAGLTRQRLQIAAEYLKTALSSQEQADYTLNAFLGRPSVRIELTRDDLAHLLAEPLARLRRVCAQARDEWRGGGAAEPHHLVLVGGPMLSPLVSGAVEEAFGRKRSGFPDPRTAVAFGAALQGAVLSGDLRETLLLDVTPLSLGISIRDAETGEQRFDTLIERNTLIPTQRSEVYTTVDDNQDAVLIQVYNGGQLDARSKIGEFRLEGIPPLPKGTPQIEVTFSYDTDCVLQVTAVDKGTGRSTAIRIADTTLLSRREIQEMTERQARQHESQDIRRTLSDLLDEAAGFDPEQVCREFRDRLAAHRPARRPLDGPSRRLLMEMYGVEAHRVESELLSLRAPLYDLTVAVRDYVAQPSSGDRAAAGRHLAGQLADHVDRMRQGLARVTAWNGLLATLAAEDGDPLRRFRALHDAGDHQRALRAHDELTEPLTDPEDLRRRLRSLAGIGDRDRYRRTLRADAARLSAIVLDRDDPAPFLSAAGPALVRVSYGSGREGGGCLISDRHVLVGGSWPAEPDAGPVVHIGAQKQSVRHVFRPDSAAIDACVILLSEPASARPLRLGFPRLVHIGDEVWAAASHDRLVAGIVQGFEPFPEQRLQLFRTDLRLPPAAGGGPLLNDLGEVIGMLARPAARGLGEGHVRDLGRLAGPAAGERRVRSVRRRRRRRVRTWRRACGRVRSRVRRRRGAGVVTGGADAARCPGPVHRVSAPAEAPRD